MAYVQDEVGSCDFLDLLEEAAVRKRPVKIVAKGEEFEDVVLDVVTENHQDFVVFKEHGRMLVKDVKSATRAETTADVPLNDAFH